MSITPIAQCREGDEVTIVGRVIAIETLVAPYTQRACVAYWVKSAGAPRRKPAIRGSATPFIVADDTGHAVVEADPEGLDLSWNLRGGAATKAVLDEAVIEPGETVAVSGCVVVESVPGTNEASGYRDGTVTRVRIVRPRRGRVTVTDRADRIQADRG